MRSLEMPFPFLDLFKVAIGRGNENQERLKQPIQKELSVSASSENQVW